MRAWLYDLLTSDPTLMAALEHDAGRVMPRQSQTTIPADPPFLIYGLGNSTSEQLQDATARDAEAERQFFQIWLHDVGGSYMLIDEVLVPTVKQLVEGASHPPSRVITVTYLETSAEFSNQTYGTIFRYVRFQAIIAKGRVTP